MDAQRKAGNTLLAISHNANLSDGWMYPVDLDSFGRPIDAAWAASRDRNERLVEIKQIKGASETHPLLSPNDEFANYEIFAGGLLGQKPDGGRIDHIQGSFGRQALKDGITMQDVRGYNPYKFGMAGGSDSHNTGSEHRQKTLPTLAEALAAKRLPLHTPIQDAVDLPKMVQVVCRFQADEFLRPFAVRVPRGPHSTPPTSSGKFSPRSTAKRLVRITCSRLSFCTAEGWRFGMCCGAPSAQEARTAPSRTRSPMTSLPFSPPTRS